MSNGLRILRRIDPDPELRRYLESEGQLEEILDKQGKSHFYVDDSRPRELEITQAIMRETLLWVLLDDSNEIRYIANSAKKAALALSGAKVVFVADVEIEDLPEADPEPEGPDLPPSRGRR